MMVIKMGRFISKNFKWVVLALAIFILTLIIRSLFNDTLKDFDILIYDFIHSFKSSFLTNVFKTITFFGSGPFLIVVSIFLFFLFKNKKYGVFSLLNLGFIVFLNQVLKLLFSRPRPSEWMMIFESGYSFPSGHAMVSMAFYGMIIFLIWRTNLKESYKKLWTIILGILVILIGISRVYLGVHYASDIVAGFMLSLSYLIIANSLLSYYLKKKNSF